MQLVATRHEAPTSVGYFNGFLFAALDRSPYQDRNGCLVPNINTFANTLASGTTTPKVNIDKFHYELLKAIINAAQAVKDVPSIGGADFEKFAVTIEYSVKWEGNASGDIPVFSFLTVTRELGGNLNSVHSVKLVFRKVPVTPSTWSGPTATPSP